VKNPNVGLLFIDFMKGWRLRIHGIATIVENDPLLANYCEAPVHRAHHRPRSVRKLPAVHTQISARRAMRLRATARGHANPVRMEEQPHRSTS